MKVYIAGPMTGLPDYNRAAFFCAAEALKEKGCYVPVHTAWMVDCLSRVDYMRMALQMMLTCEAIYLLRDWNNSAGAQTEHAIAALCGLQLMYEDDEDDC